VERVLGVLDGAVLVVSAVEGVQAQTHVLMRALRRLGIPTLIFVNKMDRRGADAERVLRAMTERLTPALVPVTTVTGAGSRDAAVVRIPLGEPAMEVLAEHDDPILTAYVEGTAADLDKSLARLTAETVVHPVFFGSAVTGAGIGELMNGITEFLPSGCGDAAGPLSGTVFKIERGPAGEKIAYVRMFSGTLRVREPVEGGKPTAIRKFDPAGQIAKVWGLDVRVGDWIGEPRATGRQFSPPTLETVIVPRRRGDRGALHAALTTLAEQDPLISVRQDEVTGDDVISLYGEVQKEVVEATLATRLDSKHRGLAVEFRDTTVVCVERLLGPGAAVRFMGDGTNPFRATVGLEIQPAPEGAGIRFGLGIETGALPAAFRQAVEDTVRESLRRGLHGWRVVDAEVTLTHSGYTPPPPYGWSKWSSSGGDFRGLTPLVLRDALRLAGTRVYEPVQRFHLLVPFDTVGVVVPALARLRAVPSSQVVRGSSATIEGEIPTSAVPALERQLPELARGEGVLDCEFARYEAVSGERPGHPRSMSMDRF
jgi:ribosomal protection tetracycline resistance protein